MLKGNVMEPVIVCKVDDSGNAELNIGTIHTLRIIKITIEGIFVFIRLIVICRITKLSGPVGG